MPLFPFQSLLNKETIAEIVLVNKNLAIVFNLSLQIVKIFEYSLYALRAIGAYGNNLRAVELSHTCFHE